MLFSNQQPLSNLFQPRQKDSSGVFFKIFILFYFIRPRRLWLVCGVSRIETSSNPAAALTPPCGFSFVSPYRKKSCDFFRGLRIFLCKSFKRYRGIIRTDCDYRKQSTPNGVGTPPLFNGEKAKTLLGRGDALRPRLTFGAKSNYLCGVSPPPHSSTFSRRKKWREKRLFTLRRR